MIGAVIMFWIVVRKCLSGFYDLLQSGSGVFALLTLLAITFVTWKQPTVGGVAFAAFASIIPAVLAIAENRETMLSMNQPPLPNPAAPPPPNPP
jgi:hypothetical protein